jgi:hypothetical protein
MFCDVNFVAKEYFWHLHHKVQVWSGKIIGILLQNFVILTHNTKKRFCSFNNLLIVLFPSHFNKYFIFISVYHIKSSGWVNISNEDCKDLHYKFQEEKGNFPA